MSGTGGSLRTADFDYELPNELIAQRPLTERDSSRLLLVDRANDPSRLSDRTFADIVEIIPTGDLLVLNTTRVRPARLLGKRPSGAPAEVLLIHPLGTRGTWLAMGKPGNALRVGKTIDIGHGVTVETLEIREDGNRVVAFHGASAEEAIARHGQIPLPPYIERSPDHEDTHRYQTVYADREGSVAAPTAGLHFTPTILAALHAKGVRLGALDLEVGPGTFRPVETPDLRDHVMHPERYTIDDPLIVATAETRAAGGHVWAVGTTVVRALESSVDRKGRLRGGTRETSLFILPGYRFQIVDRLLTNFHFPRSTLLMLVSAFAGLDATREAYRHAITQRYRFYSYGDAMLII